MTEKERRYEAINELDLLLDGLSAIELISAGLAEQHSFELAGAVSFVCCAIRERAERVQELLKE